MKPALLLCRGFGVQHGSACPGHEPHGASLSHAHALRHVAHAHPSSHAGERLLGESCADILSHFHSHAGHVFLCICCLGKARMHVAGASLIVICKRLNLDLVPVHTPAHISGSLLGMFVGAHAPDHGARAHHSLIKLQVDFCQACSLLHLLPSPGRTCMSQLTCRPALAY